MRPTTVTDPPPQLYLAALAEIERLRGALEWYAEQVAGCRKIGSIGDPFRNALNADGGKRARAALNP